MYSTTHYVAMALASSIGVAILAGILFGNRPLPAFINSERTYRQACLTAWVAAVPLWFVLESWLFPVGEENLKLFVANQQTAQYIWLIVGGIIAGVVGSDLPKAPTVEKPPHP